MNHIGIYLSNAANKDQLIEKILSNEFLHDYIDISGLQGALYSTITINRIINDEIRHDKFIITTKENASLTSMSSGQQRKALLNYLLSQQPEYIILDDVYSSVDYDTRLFIADKLNEITASTLIIQLFYRKQDVLDCIHTVFTVDNQNLIVAQETRAEFLKTHTSALAIHDITLPHLFKELNASINPLVQLNSVSAFYHDKQVLKDICWTIQTGEFWQLKGPIGSGKSTLLSMIIGDNPRGYGQDMILFGKKKGSGETIWDIKKQIGYFTPSMIFQFSHNDSVENMLISGIVDSVGLYTKPTDLQRRVAREWMQVLGPAFLNKTFQTLSFGQQRMLLVVRAMVKRPPLLILDEPTVGLDDENAYLFLNLINTIASQKKVTIIYVSHRDEPELKPEKIFELQPTPEGSRGYLRNKL